MDREFALWLKGKKVAVIGAGISGVSAAKALARMGAVVFLSEINYIPEKVKKELSNHNIQFEEGANSDKALDVDLMVLSPGVPPDAPIVLKAREKGIRVIGELELGYRLTSGKYIAVTGTNGKTTVVSLISHILAPMGAIPVGNIGRPLSQLAMQGGLFVIEVSSFQLYTIEQFKPDIAVITNISEDHIDWHGDFESYCAAKLKITQNQEPNDFLILNGEDNGCMDRAAYSSKAQVKFIRLNSEADAFTLNDRLYLMTESGKAAEIARIDELKIKGWHNVMNALFAALASHLAGADIETIKNGLLTFEGLPHRLQYVDEIHGVKFYNDSKGTNPHAVKWALKAFDKPVILIMGGEDKGVDFSSLVSDIWKKVKFLVVMGKATDKLIRTFSRVTEIVKASDINDAVLKAYQKAEPGDIIVLSPGCASFDMFRNYKERGEAFVNAVRELKSQECG